MTMEIEYLEKLTDRYFDGALSAVERDQLNSLLETDDEARRAYWTIARTHAALRAWGMEQAGIRQIGAALARPDELRAAPQTSPTPAWFRLRARGWSGWRRVAVLALVLLVVVSATITVAFRSRDGRSGRGAVVSGRKSESEIANSKTEISPSPVPVARLAIGQNCRWIDPASAPDESALLKVGRKLEVSSGEVKIVFNCGAEVILYGPAIFQIESAKSGFMSLGQLSVRAATPAARGFIVRSHSAVAEDLGTEFEMQASPDGHSRIRVISGTVLVRSVEQGLPSWLEAGQSIEVEPGSASIRARVEPGDDTPFFKFPTIEPPSAMDYADASQHHATIRVLSGKPHPNSGPADVLLDGRGQTGPDAPRESFFFDENSSGLIILDLGQTIDVRRINTYSWHTNKVNSRDRIRAVQRYYLYGARGPQPPSTQGDLTANGWTLIVRVNTDEFFGFPREMARPAQQGVSIAAEHGAVGNYQFLLWDVRPSPSWRSDRSAVEDNAFFGEFDVYGK